jgi:hypothetical protein
MTLNVNGAIGMNRERVKARRRDKGRKNRKSDSTGKKAECGAVELSPPTF